MAHGSLKTSLNEKSQVTAVLKTCARKFLLQNRQDAKYCVLLQFKKPRTNIKAYCIVAGKTQSIASLQFHQNQTYRFIATKTQNIASLQSYN